jgi:predicted PurR-regulated permease PerM
MLEATKLVEDTAASTVRARTWPTPIWVPKFVRNVLIVVTVPAVLAALVFVAWWVPSALFIVAGGFALATLLSTPVRTLSRIMPRRSRGLAVVVTFLVIVGLMVVGALFVVPRLMAQFATIADSLPALAESGRRYLLVALEQLDEWGLLAGTPEQTAPKI